MMCFGKRKSKKKQLQKAFEDGYRLGREQMKAELDVLVNQLKEATRKGEQLTAEMRQLRNQMEAERARQNTILLEIKEDVARAHCLLEAKNAKAVPQVSASRKLKAIPPPLKLSLPLDLTSSPQQPAVQGVSAVTTDTVANPQPNTTTTAPSPVTNRDSSPPSGCENFIPKTPPGEPERSVTTIAAPSTTKLPSPCPARGSDQAPAAPEFFHFPQTEESGEYSEEVKQFDRQTYKEHQQYFASVQQEHMMRSAQTNQHSHQSLPLVGSDLHRKRAGRLQHCSQLASYNQRLQSRREYCQQEQSLQAGQVGQQLVQTRAHHHAAYRRQHSSLLAAAAQANANQESRQETNLSKDRHFWNFLDQLIVD